MREWDTTRAVTVGAILGGALLAWTVLRQPPIEAFDGRGWDGRFLLAMAEGPLRIPVPPHQARIGVPLLARALPFDDLLTSFRVLSLGCALLAAIGTWTLLRRLYTPPLRAATAMIGWLLIVATPLSPIPESAWYPAQTDALSNLLILVVLALALQPRPGIGSGVACAAVFLLGTLTRENFPMFALLLFARFEISTDRDVLFGRSNARWILLAATALGSSLVGLVAVQLAVGVAPLSGKAGMYLTLLGDRSVPGMLASGVNVYGPAAFFWLAWRALPSEKRALTAPDAALGVSTRTLALGFTALVAIAAGGGGNTERFLYWGLPLAVLWLAPRVDAVVRHRPIALALPSLGALVLGRSFRLIEPSGIDGCTLGTILSGRAAWTGHWVQICTDRGPYPEQLLAAFAVAGLAVYAAARAAPER